MLTSSAKSRGLRQLGLAAVVLLLGRAAYALATRVIPETDLAKRPPMVTLAYFAEPFHLRTLDFAATEAAGGSKVVTGRDKSGKEWQMILPPTTRGLWMTLAKGVRTYFFAGYTGGGGMAPPTWIVAVSFDRRRRPVPFYLRGWARYGKEGIQDLVSLDGKGPELVQQDWIEKDSDSQRSGYYITTLYQQRGAYWYRVDGKHGQKTFPIFEKWLIQPDTQPEEIAEPDDAKAWPPDYGNDPKFGKRITATAASLGCQLQGVGLLVTDTNNGRLITVDPAPFRFSDAVLTGLRKWPGSDLCDVAEAWIGVK